MPKRSRQAHIPSQNQIRRRKARREPSLPSMPEPAVVDEPVFVAPSAQAPVATRSRRRLESLTRPADSTPHGRGTEPLPTYERAYLVSELRTIALTTGLLLAVIVVLTLLMR